MSIYLGRGHGEQDSGYCSFISYEEWLGFFYENLRKRSGLEFRPYRMGKDILEKYRSYAKPLEEQDKVKAKGMIEAGFCKEVLGYMLEEDIKLEQEIIE